MNKEWIETKKQLPDDEMAVLVVMENGEVWTGYHEDGCWWYVSADKIGVEVTHWTEFPAAPVACNAKVSRSAPLLAQVGSTDGLCPGTSSEKE